MKILAIDTSSDFISLAVLEDNQALGFVEEQMQRGQAEMLMPMIDALLKKQNLKMKNIEAIAATVGPGSFTGVRIGLATARAFGLALNIPVWGVTCFEAWAFHTAKPCKVVLDSKRDDYFVQAFDAAGKAQSTPALMSTEALKAQLPFAAIGTAADALHDEIGCEVLQKSLPLAAAVGQIAFARKATPVPPEPVYLREADVTI